MGWKEELMNEIKFRIWVEIIIMVIENLDERLYRIYPNHLLKSFEK